MTTTDLATTYIKYVKDVRKAEEVLASMKEERDRLEQKLLEAFRQDGVQSIRTSEGMAVLSKRVWARLEVEPEVLRGTPLEFLIKTTVLTQSLSAAVKELYEEGEDGLPVLPEEVKGAIKVTEVWKIGVRA